MRRAAKQGKASCLLPIMGLIDMQVLPELW